MSHFTKSTCQACDMKFFGANVRELQKVAERGVEGGATMCPERSFLFTLSFNNLKAPKPEDVRGVSKASTKLDTDTSLRPRSLTPGCSWHGKDDTRCWPWHT